MTTLRNMFWIFLSAGCAVMLVACHSVQKNGESTDENSPEYKKNKTASINVQLSSGYLQAGDMERAKGKILLALEQAPHSPPALTGMAMYLAASGQPKEAENYFKKAIAADSSLGATQNNYGVFLCQNGRYKEAIDRFMLAAHDPQYLNMADAFENAGLCALTIPDPVSAEGYFQKALQRNPQHLSTLLEISDLYVQRGQYAKAYNTLQTYRYLSGPENERVIALTSKIKANYQPPAALKGTSVLKSTLTH